MSKFLVKTALVLAMLIGVNAAFAASWTASGSKRTVTTLVICSNNKSPRLLADLIMVESKQPYLLMPAPQSKDTRIFFCPSRGPALEVLEKDLAHFVNFLKPKRIMVLGGEAFVPSRYFKNFDNTIPLFTVRSSSWQRIADELEFMLNISGLSRDYQKLYNQMMSDSEVYRPISKPKAPEETVEVEVMEAADDNVVVEEVTITEPAR